MGLSLQVMGRRLAWLVGLGLVLSLCLICKPHGSEAGSPVRASATGSGLQFAIADLDGDRKPDLASVEVQGQHASSTTYSIRLQFGDGGDSTIGVTGPLGGLRLTIRDVNGDDRLDLILTSVIDRRVVQVLLNDGYGKFAAAETDIFASVESAAEFGLCEREPSPSDRMVLATARAAFEVDVAGERVSSSHNVGSLLAVHNEPVLCSRESGPHCGRSPPSSLTVS